MPKRKMWVSWDNGAELTNSQKSPGDMSPLTRDGDNNLGQVVLQPIDDEESDEEDAGQAETVYIYINQGEQEEREATSDEIWGALALLGVMVALEHRSEIKQWWLRVGQPALARFREGAKRARPVRKRRREQTVPADTIDLHEKASIDEASTELEAYRATMGSEEARDRLVAALMAKVFADKQFDILRNARIEDPDSPGRALAAVDAVSPNDLEAALRLLLEKSPALLDSPSLSQLGMSLHSDVVVSAPSMSVRGGKKVRLVARRARQRFGLAGE